MVPETKKLLTPLNEGLEMECASQIQYLTQAAITKGSYAERLIGRFKEIAGDEAEHADILPDDHPSLAEKPTGYSECNLP